MNAALQVPDLANVRREISAMGAKFGPEEMLRTRALFKPLVEALPHSSAPLIADLPYGPDSRHRLDVAPVAGPSAPVVIFFHGGGFVAGDKNSDGVFYCNVIRYFASHDYLAIAANYRLAPAARWPAGAEDVSAVIQWTRAHAAEYGGDPGRICLLGQSAGASHIATWLINPAFERARGDIRAAVLMSGFYRPETPLTGGPLL
jgi:acetyl esterase/lipase